MDQCCCLSGPNVHGKLFASTPPPSLSPSINFSYILFYVISEFLKIIKKKVKKNIEQFVFYPKISKKKIH